jgi:hypothetical protein
VKPIDRIVTNNPAVQIAYQERFPLEFITGGYLDVLIKVRDRVHAGAVILTHPLSGSVKPNETPYKSIVLAQGTKLDWDSLQLIENAITVVRGMLKDDIKRMHDPGFDLDFQTIDLSLLSSAINDKE